MAGSAAATPETPPPSGDSGPDVPVSGELFAPVSSGIELCYQTYGDPAGQPMIMLMGLASPMTWWDPELCSMLARRGYYVITLDNRDVGRSTKVRGRVTRQMLLRAFAGLHVRAPLRPRLEAHPVAAQRELPTQGDGGEGVPGIAERGDHQAAARRGAQSSSASWRTILTRSSGTSDIGATISVPTPASL